MRGHMRAALLILALVIVLAPGAAAEEYSAILAPRPNTGSTGSGVANLMLNGDATVLTYNITFSGLTGPEVAAHIHRPDGSIAHALPLGSPKQGSWQNIGFIDVTSLQLGQLYILIHTNQNPGGELRGNIVAGNVPVEHTTWGAIKALYE